MHQAIVNEDYPTIIAHLMLGTDPNSLDDRGYTTLHLAVRQNDPMVVRTLLQHGADIHRQTPEQDTPLALALACDQLSVARLLLESGAQVTDIRWPRLLNRFTFPTEAVSLLVRFGLDVTPGLFYLTQNGRHDWLDAMLALTPKMPVERNELGETLLDAAFRNLRDVDSVAGADRAYDTVEYWLMKANVYPALISDQTCTIASPYYLPRLNAIVRHYSIQNK